MQCKAERKKKEKCDNVKLLMGIPGVDYYIALLFTSEVRDYSRFSSANKLTSWLNLAPRVHQSGDTSYNGRIKNLIIKLFNIIESQAQFIEELQNKI